MSRSALESHWCPRKTPSQPVNRELCNGWRQAGVFSLQSYHFKNNVIFLVNRYFLPSGAIHQYICFPYLYIFISLILWLRRILIWIKLLIFKLVTHESLQFQLLSWVINKGELNNSWLITYILSRSFSFLKYWPITENAPSFKGPCFISNPHFPCESWVLLTLLGLFPLDRVIKKCVCRLIDYFCLP